MIKIGIIGAGQMGRHHTRVYHELNNVELIGISDLNPSKEKLAKKYNCKFFKNHLDLLAEVDAVSVVVPTSMHKQIALDCLNAKKHLLLEKPIADSEQAAKEIIEAAKKNQVKFTVGHIERFNPVISKLKEIIDTETMGQITSISAKRVGVMPAQIKDANVIIDLAVHDIDIFNYILGKTPDTVHCSSGKALLDSRNDYADIFLQYGDTSAYVQVNWITPIKIRSLNITGTKGYLELNYLTQEITVFQTNYAREFDDFGDLVLKFGTPDKELISVIKEEPLKLELQAFVNSINQDLESRVTGEDALSALQTALYAAKISGSEEIEKKQYYAHSSADISDKVQIGKNCKIWNLAQIRENVCLGENSIISKNVYIDAGVQIGKNVKIQNNVSVYSGVTLEDGVFVGPHVCFTNDKFPRSINPDGSLKDTSDWSCEKTLIKKGASLGANSTITPGVTIGEFAMIGAGAIVTKNVPNYGLMVGTPAKLVGYVCPCGQKLKEQEEKYFCEPCDFEMEKN